MMNALDIHDAKDKIQSILSGQEYQAYHKPPGLLERLQDWLLNAIEKLLQSLHLTNLSSTAFLYFMMGILTFLLILLIVWILTRFRVNKNMKYSPVGTSAELAQSVTRHLDSAKAAIENDDKVSAVRFLFLALVRKLDETDWIQAKSWKTNFEYYDELLKEDKALADTFQQQAELFDETIYGGQAPENVAFNPYHRKILELVERLDMPQKGEGSAL